MEIKFKRDTAFRKQFFVPESFAHPAKMDAQLLIWIVEHYSEVGDTILDPMAGMGTTMLACTLGRDCILVELEEKFCKMMRDNWEQVKMRPQLGSTMGNCQIIQGDARQLEGLLVKPQLKKRHKWRWIGYDLMRCDYCGIEAKSSRAKRGMGGCITTQVDKIVTSPPYAETGVGDWQTGRAEFQAWVISELETKGYVEWQGKRYTESEWRAMNHGRIDGRTTKGVHKHPTEGYGATEGQIGNLPYGEIDRCIFSPPYAETLQGSGADAARKRISEGKYKGLRPDVWTSKGNVAGSTFGDGYSQDPESIGNLPYGQIDKIVTSPPYENAIAEGDAGPLAHASHDPNFKDKRQGYTEKIDSIITSPPYDESIGHSGKDSREIYKTKSLALHGGSGYGGRTGNNIGDLKGDTYLEAMLQVYRSCFAVLKNGGLLILVTKNFIRQKKVIRLDLDTIKLCEQAGFSFVERHYRELPSQSFWRVIYHQKFPDVEQILNEDILLFQKELFNG